MAMGNQEYVQRDLSVVWHPCTQMKDHQWLPTIPIRRGDGVWLEDFVGKRYLDAINPWCVDLFGHRNPHINAALPEQLGTLEQVKLAGFTHQAVIELSEQLMRMTPAGPSFCFYADNGSSAIEIALRMSFHYWLTQGRPEKTRFITLQNSYHGENLAALAVGNLKLYKSTYGPLLTDTIEAPSPDCYYREPGESCADYSEPVFQHMETALEEKADQVCAVMVEPLLQCAGSMRRYNPVYLKLLRDACDRHQVHHIADEIAVGLGRTGALFACEQANISPDFICLSKRLTGATCPCLRC
jgi:adenosylmethionine-8-amino-7-oxononanoate aminotransferase